MSRKWWVLSAVGCGTFLATLDASIVNVGLPTVTKVLDTELAQSKWIIIVYLLVITCTLLPFGRLSDIYGRRRVFSFGFITFTLGSAFCGIASTLSWLVISRVIQGLGAAMLMANGPAVITAAFPSNERGKALGTLAMVVSAGLLCGPSVGGFLIEFFGWRSIFLVNIPIGIAGLVLVYLHVAKDELPTTRHPFDWPGAVLQSIVLVLLIVVFDPPNISISGSNPLPVSQWLILGFTLILGAVFIQVETISKSPLFDFSLLKDRTFWTANLAGFLMFVSYSAAFVLMPFYLEEILEFQTRQTGIFMSCIPIMILVVAPVSGRLSDKFGSRELSLAGATISTLALLFMSGTIGYGLDEYTSNEAIVFSLATMGIALGLFQSPNNNAIMGAVPVNKLGSASGLIATARNLGLVVGAGLATSLFSWQRDEAGDFIEGLHVTFFVAAMIGILAMIASLGRR